MSSLPCGKKFLREFNFAGWLFFCNLRVLTVAVGRSLFFSKSIHFRLFQEVVFNLNYDILFFY